MSGDFGAYISAGTAGVIVKIMLSVEPLFRIFNDGATVVLTFCIMIKAVRSCPSRITLRIVFVGECLGGCRNVIGVFFLAGSV